MTVDAFDARLALGARGLLADFNTAGVLASADVHVARRLGALAGEADDRVLLAVALAVRAVRSGSVCVVLDDVAAATPAEAGEPGGLGAPGAVAAQEAAAPDAAADLPWPEPDAWRRAVEASPLVAVGPHGPADRPVRLVDGRLYLDRYWRDEQTVRAEVDARLTRPAVTGAVAPDPGAVRAAVARLFPDDDDAAQGLAATAAATGRLTVVTGGPGTGKTTTVARLLAVLHDVAPAGRPLRVALAAPTGKAAARLGEAVRDVVAEFDAADRARVGAPDATTIHRLLGWKSATRFRHDRDHRLPHDVVVVDESSMVPLSLMARLLEALRPEARLVLVGDPDQLASVEAGAVLGDLVAREPVADGVPAALLAAAEAAAGPDGAAAPAGSDGPGTPLSDADRRALRNGVVRLTRTHRFSGAIGDLAVAIRAGDAEAALAVLRGGGPVSFVEVGDDLTEADLDGLRADATDAGRRLVDAARAGDAGAALRALEQHRLLLAHRRGVAGVGRWADRVETWVAQAAGLTPSDLAAHGGWYPGRPLLVVTNDRDTGLYNGDTGVVVATSGPDGEPGTVAVFGDPEDPTRVRPHRLPAVQTVHAMTVHRAQGSQFGRVSVLLPPATSPLLTRELLYTAVTRAREHVRVIGTEAAVWTALGRPIRRASGLRHPLP